MKNLPVIDYGSDSSLYQQELVLRERVLREPLGLTLSHEDTLGDQEARHFGLLDDDRLVACLLATAASPAQAILRQMAVSEPYRGKGLGSVLLTEVEERLQTAGFNQLRLAARCSAVQFYRNHGYIEAGEIFDAVSIPHRWMQKNLRPVTEVTHTSA